MNKQRMIAAAALAALTLGISGASHAKQVLAEEPITNRITVTAEAISRSQGGNQLSPIEDVDMIKTATESLTEVSYSVFGKVYEQAQQQAGGAGYDAGAQGGYTDPNAGKDNVVDADYEVVDDNK